MAKIKLFTYELLRRLRANGEAAMCAVERLDHRPVMKVYNPYGKAMWLLTELDPSDSDHLYGLYDLGHGAPQLGWVSRDGLESAYVPRLNFRLPLERDKSFAPRHTLAAYTRAARAAGAITEVPEVLDAAARAIVTKGPPWQDWPPSPQPFVYQ